MKNRIVGFIIVGFALILGFMEWLYNRALNEIVSETCSHGPTCPMWESIGFQISISLAIIGAVVVVGLYFIFFVKDERPVVYQSKKIEKKSYNGILKDLSPDERYIMHKLIDAQGSLFQSDLVSETHTKVKVTRILDKLEGRGLVERKRRGMSNVVVLKH